ncbi:MAG: D-hexose-6-phosphate mutarotase [Acidobacteriaceae bacterium]
MYLHGAHVTSWRPTHSQEVIFLSKQSLWQEGRAIRGGVPICFPWFGDKKDDPAAPAHGFARSRAWTLQTIEERAGDIEVGMLLESDEETKRFWPFDFQLTHLVTFGSNLRMELLVKNTGDRTFQFEEALHTYYQVGNVLKIQIRGLEGFDYLDKTDAFREKPQTGVVSFAGETDRVYLNTTGAVDVIDPALSRRIRTSKENSHTTVIWNPWKQKAKALGDLGDDEWTQMVCVEVSNVNGAAMELQPGQEHRMCSEVSVENLKTS